MRIRKRKALYDVENVILKSLPKMAKAASDKELKAGFLSHLAETKGQAERLEQAFKLLGEKPAKTKVEAIRGMVKDTEWLIQNVKEPTARDAGLLAGAQYVEHYEMAGYGSATEWARLMGHSEVQELLQMNLDEEIATDQALNALATKAVNIKANQMGQD
jgi:ferritin-like metal-binding protein YciE